MTVHRKLMEARVRLQSTELKKSGLNKFAGYSYFELGDFIPAIQQIFYDVGLCGIVSFKSDYAELSIYDTEDGTMVMITSPMADANLKGAHPIQNLGAMESYQRRYLWMTALELVEHDAIDSSAGADTPKQAAPIPEPPPVAVTAPAVAVKPRPPAVIEGDDGEWMMKVTLSPEGSAEDWLATVDKAAGLALKYASSKDDVMKIFRKNKQLFDVVKKTDADFFTELMAKFTTVKNKFTETA
tara:strand:+ start:361 stop:1083 length:723 start_codon:yes stop_codon:yes gene_type:complete